MISELGRRTCATCAHSEETQPGHMQCTFNPPTAFPIWGRDEKGLGFLAGVSCGFPPVSPDMRCGQHVLIAVKNLRESMAAQAANALAKANQ